MIQILHDRIYPNPGNSDSSMVYIGSGRTHIIDPDVEVQGSYNQAISALVTQILPGQRYLRGLQVISQLRPGYHYPALQVL